MSQKQRNFDQWTNSIQSPLGEENALVVAIERAYVFTCSAFILRARSLLTEAITALGTPVRPLSIEVDRCCFAVKMATTSRMTLTPRPSP